MKTIAVIVIGVLALNSNGQPQPAEKRYSGKSVVAGLGKIAFPTGEWTLEFQRVQAPTNGLHLPDYFVFKKVGDSLERLTFLRYPPTTTPRPLAYMLDTIGETMGDGIPWEEKKEKYRGGEIHSMRLDPSAPTPDERTISFSFIHVRPSPAASWLCHSFLVTHDHCAFVIAHASTSVISPGTVGDVHTGSQFFPTMKPPRAWE